MSRTLTVKKEPAKEVIDAFRQRVKEIIIHPLELRGSWSFFLDLYDSVEEHRERIRHAEWPASLDTLEVGTYRLLLLSLEQQVGQNVTAMAVSSPAKMAERSTFITGMLQGFLERADAVTERLGDPQLH